MIWDNSASVGGGEAPRRSTSIARRLRRRWHRQIRQDTAPFGLVVRSAVVGAYSLGASSASPLAQRVDSLRTFSSLQAPSP